MKNKSTVVLMAVLIFAGGAILTAQPFFDGPMGREHKQPHSPLRMVRLLQLKQSELKINDQQMEQISLKALALEKQQIQMGYDENLLRLELKELELNESRDYNRIKAVFLKIAEAKADFHIAAMKARDAIKKILTPEQLEAITQMRGAMIQRRHMNSGGRPGPRGSRPKSTR